VERVRRGYDTQLYRFLRGFPAFFLAMKEGGEGARRFPLPASCFLACVPRVFLPLAGFASSFFGRRCRGETTVFRLSQ
jgi:hypothetical protein